MDQDWCRSWLHASPSLGQGFRDYPRPLSVHPRGLWEEDRALQGKACRDERGPHQHVCHQGIEGDIPALTTREVYSTGRPSLVHDVVHVGLLVTS